MPRSSCSVRLDGIVAGAIVAPSTFSFANVTSAQSTQPRWVESAVRGYVPTTPPVTNTSNILLCNRDDGGDDDD
ncbi:MAG: hypothetical protein WAM88_05220 [Nitrososphaeraceae archaeon]